MKRNILNECLRIARSKHSPAHPAWKYKAVHYSFVIQNNKIIGVGFNRYTSKPPIYYGYSMYSAIHSEIDVWKKVRGILSKNEEWEIINIKLLRKAPDYLMSDAAPCKACRIFLQQHGCRHFYFTTNHGYIAKIVPEN